MADKEAVKEITNGAGSGDVLKSALEHKGLLVPAVVSVAGALAAAKGPSLVRGLSSTVEDKVESTAEQAGSKAAEGAKESLSGGKGGLAGKAIGKLVGGGGGSSGKKTRRLPIQRWTDVAVPVDQAYDAWTRFDQYPKFMHRVLSVKKKGNDKVTWEEKIWFSRRQWEGRITEQRKNERIVWKTTSGMSHKGIVSFHRLGDRLTRVMVEMEFEPTGLIEKMGSGLRFVKRAVQADLARFKAYVELEDAKGIAYRSGGEQEKDSGGDDTDENGDGENREPRRTSSSRTRSSRTRTSSTKSGTARRKQAKRTTSSGTSARKRKTTTRKS